MTKLPEIMFRKAALILIPLVSLIIANANAGSAVVVSNNGYYAAAWGQFLNAEQAIAKASELCQKKGGTDIKVLLSRPIFYSERRSFLGRSSPGAAWRAIEVLVSQKCSAISLA